MILKNEFGALILSVTNKKKKAKEKEKVKLIQSRVVTYMYNMIKKIISVHRVANLRPTKEKTV